MEFNYQKLLKTKVVWLNGALGWGLTMFLINIVHNWVRYPGGNIHVTSHLINFIWSLILGGMFGALMWKFMKNQIKASELSTQEVFERQCVAAKKTWLPGSLLLILLGASLFISTSIALIYHWSLQQFLFSFTGSAFSFIFAKTLEQAVLKWWFRKEYC